MATRQTVREAIQWQSDLGNWAGLSTTDANNLIQSAYDDAWNILNDVHDEYATKVGASFTLVGGPTGNTYTLSTLTDLLRVKSVQMQWGGRWGSMLPRAEHMDRGAPGERSYLITGGTLYVEPYETAAGTYRVWYVYRQTPFANDADAVIDPTNGALVQYMIDSCSYRAQVKDKAPQDSLVALKQEFAEKIRRWAKDRSENQPKRISDQRGVLHNQWRTKSGIPPY